MRPDILRPPRLRRGDTVAMVSLSAGLAAAFPHVIHAAERVLAERLDLTLVAAPNAWRDAAYLRAHPQARADDLAWALENDAVHGIVSAIGGDDAVRVALLLDPEQIRRHPKPLLGFSDTSAIHVAFARAASGPVALQGDAPAEGRLVGGCAEVLEMLKGTPAWYPDWVWDDAVLLLETSEDVPPPEFVGYWLRNYGAMGVLERLAGLVLARPRGYDDDQREALRRIVPRVLSEFGRRELPVLFDVACGHTQPMHTVPLLCRVRVDPGDASFTVLEAGVQATPATRDSRNDGSELPDGRKEP